MPKTMCDASSRCAEGLSWPHLGSELLYRLDLAPLHRAAGAIMGISRASCDRFDAPASRPGHGAQHGPQVNEGGRE